MRNIWIIFQKELKSYFSSPIAYGLLVFFGLLVGYINVVAVMNMAENGARAASMGQPIDVNEWIVRPLLQNAAIFGLFLIPLIAMRIFSEETRSGTIELLLTSPVTDAEIIVGKWLGALAMYGSMIALVALNLAMLFAFGSPDPRPVLSGLLGLMLQGGALLTLGTFISSLTKNQIVAGAATFAASLLNYLSNWISEFNQAPWAKVVSYASVVSHTDNFSKGLIDSKDVIYYLTFIFFGLFLTSRSLESLRWKA